MIVCKSNRFRVGEGKMWLSISLAVLAKWESKCYYAKIFSFSQSERVSLNYSECFDSPNVIGKKQPGLSLLKRKNGLVVIFLSACNSEIVKRWVLPVIQAKKF